MSNTILNSNNSQTDSTDVPVPVANGALDQMLMDIRSGRRLERIVDNVKHFLNMQVEKVEHALGQCEAAVENDRQLQQLVAEFEKEKHQWTQTRMAEIERLSIASDELAKAWAQLENDRRKFLDSKAQR